MNKTTQTYAIGSVQDFLLQIGRVVIAGNIELAVFRASDGAIYAVENRSPHPKGDRLLKGSCQVTICTIHCTIGKSICARVRCRHQTKVVW